MNLVSALLAARAPLSFREIAGTVIGYDDGGADDAIEKRFDRDKADLRDLGIPIEYVAADETGRGGYVVRSEAVFQQRVTFTSEESVLLSIAGRVGSAATGGGALEEALKSALRKLAVDILPADAPEDRGEVSVLRSSSGDRSALERVSVLAKAVATHRRVRFGYRGLLAAEVEVREVDPYGFGLAKGEWYLAGYCHARSSIRVFKLSRITSAIDLVGAEDQPVRFTMPSGFRLADHVGQEIWDFGDGELRPVRLAARAGVPLGASLPGAREVGSTADGAVFEVQVRRPEALVPWLLSREGDVRVLDPAELRAAVAAEARRRLAALRRARTSRVAEPSPAVGRGRVLEGEAS